MIQGLIEELARKIVVSNAAWLREVRTIGHYLNVETGPVIIDQNGDEIGLTDREGNSGYLRFLSDQGFTCDKIPSYSSCATSSRYIYRLRLIIAAKTETPENLTLLLSTQINSYTFTDKSVITRVTGGGSNSNAIQVAETSQEQWNTNYRIVYLDVTLQFDWRNDCELIPITMTCDNCASVYDLGCFQHCEVIPIGNNASYTGTMTLNTHFNGIVVTQGFDVAIGEEIAIPAEGLNENYEYNIQLRDEDGEVVELTFGSPAESYDCVKIKLLP